MTLESWQNYAWSSKQFLFLPSGHYFLLTVCTHNIMEFITIRMIHNYLLYRQTLLMLCCYTHTSDSWHMIEIYAIGCRFFVVTFVIRRKKNCFIIEQASNILKACFPIMKRRLSFHVRDIIVACVAIHNFLLKQLWMIHVLSNSRMKWLSMVELPTKITPYH